MTLSFTLEDGLYVAEFEATSRFNLHLERPASGSIYMKQKTVKDGSYVIVKDFGWNRDGDLIIDADCGQGAVYPKWIRLESAVEPSVAEVTFESESSGGGAGNSGGGNENTYEYIDVRELAELKAPLIMYSLAVRVRGSDNYTMPITSLLTSTDSAESVFNSVMAVMLDLSFVIDLGSEGKFETRELYASMGIDLSSLPHLTKEQFYNLEA